MKTLLTLLALFSLAASAQAPEEIYYQELIEWVFQPCMEVATALEVKNMDQETRVSVFKQMGQMFGLAKGVFCASFSCYAACR